MLRTVSGLDDSISRQWNLNLFPKLLSRIPRVFGYILIVFLAFEGLLWAQLPGNRIQHIKVEGNRHIETQAIVAKLSIQVGDPFSNEKVREQIQKIYNMGFFEEVDVATDVATDGIVVAFRVKEKPFTVEVVYDGNDELSDENLGEKNTIGNQTFLDQISGNYTRKKGTTMP
jgi:outer membrane protein assembly factor BamA